MNEHLPCRTPWRPFPNVVILADVTAVKGHPAYLAAKAGDADAASALVADLLTDAGPVERLVGDTHPTLLSVHAVEGMGVNAIPEALADVHASGAACREHRGADERRGPYRRVRLRAPGASGYLRR